MPGDPLQVDQIELEDQLLDDIQEVDQPDVFALEDTLDRLDHQEGVHKYF